jgi:hypothetical protein
VPTDQFDVPVARGTRWMALWMGQWDAAASGGMAGRHHVGSLAAARTAGCDRTVTRLMRRACTHAVAILPSVQRGRRLAAAGGSAGGGQTWTSRVGNLEAGSDGGRTWTRGPGVAVDVLRARRTRKPGGVLDGLGRADQPTLLQAGSLTTVRPWPHHCPSVSLGFVDGENGGVMTMWGGIAVNSMR